MEQNIISENMFQAMEILVKERLNNISFDKTEKATIISQDEKDKNKYYVSNGDIKYEAYSYGEEYKENATVYVTIPQGNYEMEKIIISGYNEKTEELKSFYTKPFQNFIVAREIEFPKKYEEYIVTATINGSGLGDRFNSIDIIPFDYNYPLMFDYIGLEVAFDIDTSGHQGKYYLKLTLLDKDENALNKETDYLFFSSDNVYGNPYKLKENLTFQHLFKWPKNSIKDITQIKKIQIELSQDNNFKENDGGKTIQLVKANLKFGYDKETLSNNDVQLILKPINENNDGLLYSTMDNEKSRQLYIHWNYIDKDGKLYLFNNQFLPPQNLFLEYSVFLLHYVDGYGENKDFPNDIGWNWETVLQEYNPDFYQQITLTTLYKTDQYKVVIAYKVNDEDELQYLESNAIVFRNRDGGIIPGAASSSSSSLMLSLEDGDTGVYNFYGLDGNIMNETFWDREHKITAKFIDGLEWNKDEISSVNWIFPKVNTMISPFELIEIGRDENDEPIFENELEILNKELSSSVPFKIKSSYLPGAMDNTIICEVQLKNGEIRRGSLTLQFGEASTMGSKYSLNIDFLNEATCLYAKGNEISKIKVKASFENQNGEVVTIPKIEWSWVYSQEDNDTISCNGIEITKEDIDDENTRTLTYTSAVVPEENYSILQAFIENYNLDNGITSNLIAYLPIPIALWQNNENEYKYISGPTRVVYDMVGNAATYNKDSYRLYTNNKEEITFKEDITDYTIASEQVKIYINDKDYYYEFKDEQGKTIDAEETLVVWWDCNLWYYNGKNNRRWEQKYQHYPIYWSIQSNSINNIPSIKVIKDNFTLVPLSIAPTNQIPKVSLNCIRNLTSPSTVVWSQPILILNNKWQSQLINEWDGSLTIDEKKGSILTPLLVAGKKEHKDENENVFSGVVIGDISRADLGKTTGIYGFQKGQPRFYFNENGEAYIGKIDYVGKKGEEKPIESSVKLNNEGELSINTKNFDICAYGYNEYPGYTSIYRTFRICSEDGEWEGYGDEDSLNLQKKGITLLTPEKADNGVTFCRPRIKIGSIKKKFINDEIITGIDIYEGCLRIYPKEDSVPILWTDDRIMWMRGALVPIDNYPEPTDYIDIGTSLIIKKDDIWGEFLCFRTKGKSDLGGYKWNYSKNIFEVNVLNDMTIISSGSLNELGFSAYHFHNASEGTYGYKLPLIIKSNSGHLSGNWYLGDAPMSATSDLNKKRDIECISDFYDKFFDNLLPVTYKYKEGTSDRVHIGFISQYVKDSLEKANLTTQDFAGVVIEDTDWYLRYGEFIALNTWQIQKLKTRVVELENEIKEIKQQYEI